VPLPRAVPRRSEPDPGAGGVGARRARVRALARARDRVRAARRRRGVDRQRGGERRRGRRGHRRRGPDPHRPPRSQDPLTRASDSNMAPWSCWSEWATGTNGMGTALQAPGPVLISGPEHWCVGLHEWVCAGVAVRDAVTHEPVAVLDVSAWRANLPAQAATW